MMWCCFFFDIQALSELYTSMKIMQPKCARNKHFVFHLVKILPSPLLTALEALRNHEYVLDWWFLRSLGSPSQNPKVKTYSQNPTSDVTGNNGFSNYKDWKTFLKSHASQTRDNCPMAAKSTIFKHMIVN